MTIIDKDSKQNKVIADPLLGSLKPFALYSGLISILKIPTL